MIESDSEIVSEVLQEVLEAVVRHVTSQPKTISYHRSLLNSSSSSDISEQSTRFVSCLELDSSVSIYEDACEATSQHKIGLAVDSPQITENQVTLKPKPLALRRLATFNRPGRQEKPLQDLSAKRQKRHKI